MYCFHIIVKGVRKERTFKGHDATKFPVSLRFFCRAVLFVPLRSSDFFFFLPFMEHFKHPKRNVLYFLTLPPFFLSFCLSISCLSIPVIYKAPHSSMYWWLIEISANWKLPGQENNQSLARCWKDLAASGFHVLPKTTLFQGKGHLAWTVATWFWVALAIFFRQISFLPWVSLWFPCLFAGRWCHPVSE